MYAAVIFYALLFLRGVAATEVNAGSTSAAGTELSRAGCHFWKCKTHQEHPCCVEMKLMVMSQQVSCWYTACVYLTRRLARACGDFLLGVPNPLHRGPRRVGNSLLEANATLQGDLRNDTSILDALGTS
eukprot:TRINITY_DN12286_c0_g1_i2.p1 TRINITY_DN12286_c0_g1~~TRINITY_DN12286_c0_g1_i2.p1  ORF type:complete len:129 (+),score=15.24 TRINITY_DN12286_c0_g1_i2:99-485(+)